MPWVRLDDRTTECEKHVAAGPLACWVWIECLCYSARNLSDGRVPRKGVDRWGSPEITQRLIDLAMLDLTDNPDILQVHDYLDYNPSRLDVEAGREATRQRVTAWRQGRPKAATAPLTTAAPPKAPPTAKEPKAPAKAATPSTLAECVDYLTSLGAPPTMGEEFWDYWEARGWVSKSGRIRDWQAAARTWKRNAERYDAPKQGGLQADAAAITAHLKGMQ